MHYSNFDNCSWHARLKAAHEKRVHRKNIVDDGFYSHMARDATFESLLEIPTIKPVKNIIIPKRAIPFSEFNNTEEGDSVVFFENDPLFADVLLAVDDFISEFLLATAVSTPDCSLYRDMPFVLQCANTYMNRLVGHYIQSLGHEHLYPTVRWGDERTYEPYITDTPLSFIGLPKHSAYWIGSYGVSKRRDDKNHLKLGLESMIEFLEPEYVFVYGSMPDEVFKDCLTKTQFIQYPDWLSSKHGKGPYGKWI